MRFPISVSKITAPRFPHILPRPRLIELLQQLQDKKLILILGPAAQGKSTLGVSWVNSCKTPAAWINLGPEDADPASLFYELVQSLGQALPDMDFSPSLAYPAMSMGPREELPLYREWVLSLFNQVSVPVWFVLDGLDQLPPEAAAYRFLQVLLDETPPAMHFLMLSREVPPINLEARKMRQAAYVIPGEKLAFTLEETKEFLESVQRLSLSSRSAKQIQRLTEGWAGGLVILCEGLARLPEDARADYLFGDLTEEFKVEVFKYFGEQIFASLPPATQEFLIKSTILEVVEPTFIKDLLGVGQAREILDDLAQRNLFVQPIFDKKKGWSYRYHQLFRDYLSAKFKARLEEDQQRAVHLRAGELFEQRGQGQEAVNYYLRAQAYAKATAVIRNVGPDLLKRGKDAEVSQWLQAFPPNLLTADPWLLFLRYMTRRFSGSSEDILDLLKARPLFEQGRDDVGAILSLAYLLEAAVARGHSAIPPLNELLDQAERLLQSSPASQYLPEKAVLWFQMGFAYFYRGAAPKKGVMASQQAYLLARDSGDIPLQIGSLAYAIGSLATMGEFTRAEEMVQQGEKLLAKCPHAELQAIFLIQLSHYYFYKGDFVKLAEVLGRAREQTEEHGLTYLYPVVRLYDLCLQGALGNYREAEEIGRVMLHMTAAIGHGWFHGCTLMLLGFANYVKGDFLKAREMLMSGRKVLSLPESKAEAQLTFIKIWLGLVAYHLQENGQAERGVQEAVEHARHMGVFPSVMSGLMTLALLMWRQGRIHAATSHLQTALTLSQDLGLESSQHLTREDFLKICTLALELGLEEVWDYVSHLLNTRLADIAGPELEKLLYHPDKRVAQKAWEIRRTIHRSRAPHLRIQTLGGFRVWRGESLLAEDDWEGRQSQLLLKAILAHGAQGVAKDVLLEDLWPEADPEGAEKNFKVIMHRLRKFLEPHLDKNFGSSYLHLKANLVFLDQELCRIDVEEFLTLLKAGAKKEANGQLKQAISLYKTAVESFRGDFLPEELYFPWAEAKRLELRSKYTDLLHQLAELYEKQGTLTRAIDCYKKLVNTDPLDEPAYQRLMLLLARRGMRSAALKVYQDCCQALRIELDTEPDKVTTAIYQNILTP